MPDWYTARRVGEPVYGYKTNVERDGGRILGAHLVGPHADEVINLFGLGIRRNLTVADMTFDKVAANYAGNDAAAAKFKEETGIPVYKWDVSSYERCVEGVQKVSADLGPIDILIRGHLMERGIAGNSGIVDNQPLAKLC